MTEIIMGQASSFTPWTGTLAEARQNASSRSARTFRYHTRGVLPPGTPNPWTDWIDGLPPSAWDPYPPPGTEYAIESAPPSWQAGFQTASQASYASRHAADLVAHQSVALLPDAHAARQHLTQWIDALEGDPSMNPQSIAAAMQQAAIALGMLGHAELADALHATGTHASASGDDFAPYVGTLADARRLAGIMGAPEFRYRSRGVGAPGTALPWSDWIAGLPNADDTVGVEYDVQSRPGAVRFAAHEAMVAAPDPATPDGWDLVAEGDELVPAADEGDEIQAEQDAQAFLAALAAGQIDPSQLGPDDQSSGYAPPAPVDLYGPGYSSGPDLSGQTAPPTAPDLYGQTAPPSPGYPPAPPTPPIAYGDAQPWGPPPSPYVAPPFDPYAYATTPPYDDSKPTTIAITNPAAPGKFNYRGALRLQIPTGPEAYDGQWRLSSIFLLPDLSEIASRGYVLETSTLTGQPPGTEDPTHPGDPIAAAAIMMPTWRLVTEAQADADTADYQPVVTAGAGVRMGGTDVIVGQFPVIIGVALVQRRRVPIAPVASLALSARALKLAPRGAVFGPVTQVTRTPMHTALRLQLPTGQKATALRPRPILIKPGHGATLPPHLVPTGAASHVPTTPYDGQWRRDAEWNPPAHPSTSYRFVHRMTPRGGVWRFITRHHTQGARVAGADGSGASTCGASGGAGASGASVGSAASGSNVCGGAATGSSTCGSVTPAVPPRAGGDLRNGSYIDGSFGSGNWPATSARTKDSTDALSDPLYQDPRVKVPSSLLSAPEHVLYQDAIIGGYAIIGASCLSSDRRSSMEEFWRRREAIVGQAPQWLAAAGQVAAAAGGAIASAFNPQPARGVKPPTPPVNADAGAAVAPPTAPKVTPPPRPWISVSRPSGSPRPGATGVKAIPRPLPAPAPSPVVPPGFTCSQWQASLTPPAVANQPGAIMQTRPITIRNATTGVTLTQTQRRWCWPLAQVPTQESVEQQIVDAVLLEAQLEQIVTELSQLDDGARWSWLASNPDVLLAMIDLGWIDVPPELGSLENAPADSYSATGYDNGGYPAAVPGQASPASYAPAGPSWQSAQWSASNIAPGAIAGCGPWRRVDVVGAPRGMRWIFSDDRQWMCLASSAARVGQARTGTSTAPTAPKPKDHDVPPCGPWLDAKTQAKQIGRLPPGYYWQRQYQGGQLLRARMCPKRVTVAGASCCTHCAARDAGAIRIGDVWGDIGHAVAQADQQVISPVWDAVKTYVPYGQQFDQLHQARMNLLRQAAPDFYGQPSTATDDAISAAQELSRAVRRGDATAKDRAVQIKEAAAGGDPAARRAWFAYVQIARDDDRRIETGQ